jgi:hypothetical protein
MDTQTSEWFQIKPILESVKQWPTEHDYSKFMSSTTAFNKGLIMYIGGNSTLEMGTSPSIAALNAEYLVQ